VYLQTGSWLTMNVKPHLQHDKHMFSTTHVYIDTVHTVSEFN